MPKRGSKIDRVERGENPGVSWFGDDQGYVQESSRVARSSLRLAILIAAGSVIALLLSWFSFMPQEQSAREDLLKARSAAAEISLSDEILTMSANMAAVTGDLHWIERYDERLPKIALAIDQALALVELADAGKFRSELLAANNRLEDLERRSFDAIRAGDMARARQILESDAYSLNKLVLSRGVDAFTAKIVNDAESKVAALFYRHQRLVMVVGSIAILLSLLIWFQLDRSLRKSAAVAEEAETEVRRLAHCDVLTGLANRRSFSLALEKEVAKATENGKKFWVFMIDLDRFKPVNDFYGHQAGDAVLKEVARRLQVVAGADCRIARYGGDEFAAVAPDGPNAQQLGNLIVAALSEPLVWQEHKIQIGVSVSMARFPDHAATADLLLDLADAALYRVKKSGRGSAHTFTPEEVIAEGDLVFVDEEGHVDDVVFEDEARLRPYYR